MYICLVGDLNARSGTMSDVFVHNGEEFVDYDDDTCIFYDLSINMQSVLLQIDIHV